MATADEEAMEGHRGGLEVEETMSPVGQVSVGGEGHGCGFGGSVEATSSFLCLSFVFPYCWWSGRPTMTG